MRKGDFEEKGYVVRIGTESGFDYATRDYSRTLLEKGLTIETDGYWFFIGPDGYMWHYPSDMDAQRDWRYESQFHFNVAIWTEWYLSEYPNNSDLWRESVRAVNILAMHRLQAEYDKVLRRVSLVK